MNKIKRVGVFSAAKICAVFMALFGLIIGILSMFLGMILNSILKMFSGMMPITIPDFSAYSIYAIIALPIAYAIAGFVMGIIYALLYNFTAKIVGGLKIELAE